MRRGRFDTVSVRHLRALVAVFEEGTFQRAADQLGFSQAAISQQIAALEKAVGSPLFDRFSGPRPVRLTPAGDLMLTHAKAVLGQLHEAEGELAELQAGRGWRLRVGTFQSVSVRLLPRIITELRCTAPDLDISLHESDDALHLREQLNAGDLDLTFLIGPLIDPRLHLTTLCVDPFLVLVPAGDRHAQLPAYPARELHHRACIGQEEGSACQELIEAGLRNQGVVPRFVFRTNDNAAVQAMVRAGVGPAVLPALSVDSDDPGVAVLDLDPPIAPREIVIARQLGRALPPVAGTFVDLAVRNCQAPGVPAAPTTR